MALNVRFCKFFVFIYIFIIWTSSIIASLANHGFSQEDYFIGLDKLFGDKYNRSRLIVSSSFKLIQIFGLIGCWAVWSLNRLILCGYSLLLLFIVAILITAAVFIYSWNTNFLLKLEMKIRIVMNEMYESQKELIIFNTLQKHLECCGHHYYKDWLNTLFWFEERRYNTNTVVPLSCCKRTEVNASLEMQKKCVQGPYPFEDVFDRKKINTGGCKYKIEKLAERKFKKKSILILSFIIIYSIGMIYLCMPYVKLPAIQFFFKDFPDFSNYHLET
ncbi:tetraspanin-3-like [Centruroides sculpturatus]|uniref:tetraspanin-3-like n=1 Tax=Centruroides sculpturatus TaxID=218467 RepID=UPI000C6D2603|nr:tetraspanin-3-like [Centruroides sculpturatus]